MSPAPDPRRELGDWRLWTVRAIVVLLPAAAGLTVVGLIHPPVIGVGLLLPGLLVAT